MKRLLLFLLVIYTSILHAQLNPQLIQIPMRDGKNLSAHLYLPSQQGNFPVILIQTPYNKLSFLLGLPLGVGQNLSNSPYAFVVLDWRCFYGSAGACVAMPDRGKDGYDAVEWIASQSWCNGKVATWGLSALGNIQFMTAKEQPPHLVCAIPMVASPQTAYADYFPGGAARTEYLETLGVLFAGSFALIPANPYYNIIWQIAENTTMYPQDIKVPMLLMAGWFDHNISSDIIMFDTLRALSPVGSQHRLLIGPWRHGGIGLAQQGDLSFPQAVGWQNTVANQFLGYYLFNENNGWPGTAPVQYFQMGDNTWQTAQDFPPGGANTQTYYLRENHTLDVITPTGSFATLNYSYDPNDPSPTIGGKTLDPTLLQGPYDQSQEVESRSDALVFSTPILQQDLKVQGNIKANIFFKSDRKDTDLTLRLTEVYPDGKSVLLGETVQRMRFREGYTVADTAFMQPNQIYSVNLSFEPLANTFKAGNRIRLIVTSSNYPRYNRNMNTGGEMYPENSLDTLINPLIAHNTVYMEGMYPSRIDLPVVGGTVPTTVPTWEEEIVVYPNPASAVVTVEHLPSGYKYWIRDVTGAKAPVSILSKSRDALSFRIAQAGIYFLIIENSAGKRTVRKIVITGS